MGEQERARDKTPDEKKDEARQQGASEENATEKPEPNEEQKEKAAQMMTAYEDRPTLVLPGTGRTVSGTAVGDWLDDDGNPKAADDEDAPAAKAKADAADHENIEEQIAKDKEFNKAVLKEAENKAGASK